MGIYTNHSNNYYTSSDYRDVEPFHGEHFNYHELGIIAAAESAANQNSFMKAIAINELASVEQYGTEAVFYESVNIKGIFERIKAFFKKIIEKIHKIFHTFIAKMTSWFSNTSTFAKKYEKEIIKNWGLVKNDWEFKGYKFKNILLTKEMGDSAEQTISAEKNDDVINTLKASANATAFADELKKWATTTTTKVNATTMSGRHDIYTDGAGNFYAVNKKSNVITKANKDKDGNWYSNGNAGGKVTVNMATLQRVETDVEVSSYNTRLNNADKEAIAKFREDFNEKGKDQIRYQLVEGFKKNNNIIINKINCNFDSQGAYDSKEFTDELHKAIYGEDDKEDLEKKDIESMYGGSISSMLTFLKDYDKIKSKVEKAERNLINTIDKRIKAIDAAQNAVIKDSRDNAGNSDANENIVQISTVFQSFWGFIKECETQVFSTYLQGLKDACSQAKQIAVSVIGLNKKMTESYDYYSSSSNNGFDSFIENTRLV
jgi:hypothetical protein